MTYRYRVRHFAAAAVIAAGLLPTIAVGHAFADEASDPPAFQGSDTPSATQAYSPPESPPEAQEFLVPSELVQVASSNDYEPYVNDAAEEFPEQGELLPMSDDTQMYAATYIVDPASQNSVDDQLQVAADPKPTIEGPVTAGSGTVNVTLTGAVALGSSIDVRVYESSQDSTKSAEGESVGGYTLRDNQGEGSYPIDCDSAKLIEGRILRAFLTDNTYHITSSSDAVTITARDDKPASVAWGSGTSEVDVLTSSVDARFDIGTTIAGEGRVYYVQMSSAANMYTDTDTFPTGETLAQGTVTENGTITIPIDLQKLVYGNYVDVIFAVPSFTNTGVTTYSHTGAKRILDRLNGVGQITPTYENGLYNLEGSVRSASRVRDDYVYTWYNSDDSQAGVGKVLTGVSESSLNGMYLVVSANTAPNSLNPQLLNVSSPAWVQDDEVSAASPEGGAIHASWQATQRKLEQALVTVAADSYKVELLKDGAAVATQVVAGTSADFGDLSAGDYTVRVTPMNANTVDGEPLTSAAVAVQDAGEPDAPVIDPDPEPVSYSVTSDGVWAKGGTAGLAFRGSGSFSAFVGAKIDGVQLTSPNYSLAEGSTVLTLNRAYLESLSTGTHSLEMQWTDGAASTTFQVQEAAAVPDSPSSGDEGESTAEPETNGGGDNGAGAGEANQAADTSSDADSGATTEAETSEAESSENQQSEATTDSGSDANEEAGSPGDSETGTAPPATTQPTPSPSAQKTASPTASAASSSSMPATGDTLPLLPLLASMLASFAAAGSFAVMRRKRVVDIGM